jgi:4-amino-4-deoxy-L-arabinose transferase-like glycosyltransferase
MSEQTFPSLRTVLREFPVQIALALALGLRLFLAFLPALPHLTGDSAGYIDPGVNLFAHARFAMTCDPRCVPTLWRTPGYPFVVGLLVGFLKLPLGAVYVLQAFFDTATTLLAAAMGWALGGKRVGVVAALVYGLDPFVAVFAGQIMTESLATLALTVAVYAVWRLSLRAAAGPAIAWIALGLLLGFAALVRPVLAPFPALLALAAFEPARWREQARDWALAAGGFALIVAPWVARNWLVSRNGGADDSFQVMASTTSPFYRGLSTPGFARWYQSYEQPFIWDRPREAPIVATYLLPDEKARVETLFDGLRKAGLVVTPELDAAFDRLARERIASHPFRATVLPPLSLAVRYWVTPRLSSISIDAARLSGPRGKLLFAAAVGYNALLSLLGFAAGALLVRRVAGRLLLAVPVFLTGVHSLIMWGNHSRYVVPGFPEVATLAALGGVLLVDRVRRRRRLDADTGAQAPRLGPT